MTYMICEWDSELGEQITRDATPAEATAIDLQRNLPPPVPQSVTRRQARQALLLHGLLENVDPLIAAIPDATQRGLAQIEWGDSQDFERNRPLLILIGTALGLDSAGLDALFIQAAAL